MPPDSSYPSQVWIDDVRFFQDHFENSEPGIEYRNIAQQRREENHWELAQREVELAMYKGELTPSSDIRQFHDAADRRLARAEKVGDRSAAIRADMEAKELGVDR